MYGFPKIIGTQHDVELLMTYLGSDWATDENRERGLSYLHSLIGNQQVYVFDRVLADNEPPDGPEPEYIVTTLDDEETGSVTRRQMRLQDNPAAEIHRLGYTVAEVQAMIQQIEGAQ